MPIPYQLYADSICRKVGGTLQEVLSTRLNLGVHAHTLHISKENTGIAYDSAHTHGIHCTSMSYMSLTIREIKGQQDIPSSAEGRQYARRLERGERRRLVRAALNAR